MNVAFDLEQRHGALSGIMDMARHTWHSTPGVENGSQLLGRSFPSHDFLSFFFSHCGCGDVIIAFGDGKGA